jgi:hypothetical protein
VFGRKVAILKHAPLLEELIKDRRYFWKYDQYGRHLADKFRKQMSLRNFIIKSLSAISVVMLLYFFLTPVFKTSAQVPQESWVPEPKNYFTPIVYTLQIICLSESIPVAIIIDGTFLLMCGEFEIQFVLLKKTLQSIRIGENSAAKHESFCFKKLKQCSAYHCLLLE